MNPVTPYPVDPSQVLAALPAHAADDPLVISSIDVLLAGQDAGGAFIASPSFAQYHYAWLRDGAYCALALDAVGLHDRAFAFHTWVSATLTRHAARTADVTAAIGPGNGALDVLPLPTRFTLDGDVEPNADDWPNFQIDGYGTWLFALHRHLDGAAPIGIRDAVVVAADYLTALWRRPCYDYWEEYGDRVHTSTLVSVAAGLRAAAELVGDETYAATAEDVVHLINSACHVDGRLAKSTNDGRVDASLLSAAVPFGILPTGSPTFTRTIEAVRSTLVSPGGGVWRYRGDTYYGGGEWVLLTAWLGWCDAVRGDVVAYENSRDWVRRQVDADGQLPEQVAEHAQDPLYIPEWTQRWGASAHPLLWSHAKYLLMEASTWN